MNGNAVIFESDRYGMKNHASWGSTADILMAFTNQEAYDRYRLSDEDFALLHEAVALAPTILVWTKGDLPAVPCPVKRYEEIGCPAVTVSAKVRDLDELCNEISCAFPQDLWGEYGEILTNARQEEAASRAREAVRQAREALEGGVTPDALLTDVEEALEAFGRAHRPESSGRT